jgi:hypothetical protein
MPFIYHPDVVAERQRRESERPRRCHQPWGCVHVTAQKPRPFWCARPLGHDGRHMTEDEYAEHRKGSRGRQRAHREAQKGP